jgi:RNA recognition motif-containing protein
MTSKQKYLVLAILAVIGLFAVSQLDLSPVIAFIVGLLLPIIVLQSNSKSEESVQTADEDKATTTLYVGNLPYKANESHVRQLFSEYGEVFAVRLMKDKRTGKRRGFGFVVVASKDTDSVIETLNDHDYMQRTLKVRVANDPKHPETA